mmetsp:Transcript_26534/g.69249  ORF Transcript_26534/g.69249 Transcript_26534/m.69249 type:complete len:328 (-) Transcript_26534:34-1017(-)
MEQHHRDTRRLELLGHEDPRDVTRRPTHVMPIISALASILGLSPFYRTSLAADYHDLAALQEACGIQRGGDAERTQPADVDLLKLLLVVQRRDGLLLFSEIASVVNADVDRGRNRLGHLLDRGRVLHIDALHDLRHAQRVELAAAPADGDDHLGALGHELLDNGKAKAPVSSRHQDPLPLQVRAVVHRRDVQVTLVLLLLGPGESGDLVRQRIDAVGGGPGGVGRLAGQQRPAQHGQEPSGGRGERVPFRAGRRRRREHQVQRERRSQAGAGVAARDTTEQRAAAQPRERGGRSEAQGCHRRRCPSRQNPPASISPAIRHCPPGDGR